MFVRSPLTAVVLAAVCGLGVQVNAVPANCDRTYVVAPGDTCDGISASESVSTFQLAQANLGTINEDCSNLVAGEEICLGLLGQDCTVTHVVESGETCASIAQAAGTTVGVVLANNPNVNSGCTNVYPGEVLCTEGFVVDVRSESPISEARRAL